MKTRREIAGVYKEFFKRLIKRIQLIITDRDKNTVLQNEVNRL